MRLSTSINVYCGPLAAGYPPEKILETLLLTGFSSLDFNMANPTFFNGNWECKVGQIASDAAQMGIVFGQAHAPIVNFCNPLASPAEIMSYYEYAISAAAILGVKWLVVHPGTIPDEPKRAIQRDQNLEWIHKILVRAEAARVGIALENLFHYVDDQCLLRRLYGSTTDELIDLVDTIRHPHLGICIDTGHVNLQRLDMRSTLCEVGSRLKATHINDNFGRQDDHLLPFTGSIEWGEVMAGLREIGYSGDFSLEAHRSFYGVPMELRREQIAFAHGAGRFLISQLGG